MTSSTPQPPDTGTGEPEEFRLRSIAIPAYVAAVR